MTKAQEAVVEALAWEHASISVEPLGSYARIPGTVRIGFGGGFYDLLPNGASIKADPPRETAGSNIVRRI
jgi:hypothetical protein